MRSTQQRLADALASDSLLWRSAAMVLKVCLEGIVAALCTSLLFVLPLYTAYAIPSAGLTPREVAGAWLTCVLLATRQIYCFTTTESKYVGEKS